MDEKNKAFLLKWVTEADFTNQFSLTNLADHPFQLDESEQTKILGQSHVLKILKV